PGGKWDYSRDSYTRYYATGKGIEHDRQHPLNFGLAVILPTAQKLYPFRELEKNPIIKDQVESTPLVVFFHPKSRTAVAFDAREHDRILTFGSPQFTDSDVLVKDQQTGSTWSGLTGRCLNGALQGTQLRQLTTTQFVIENWLLHYPHGPIYHSP